MDLVQEIKARTDLVELISAYVPLKRSGRTHKGLCPFHSEKTPSFTVDAERGFFRCYGCGKGGDCFTFIREKDGLSFDEAGELLARRLGLEWRRQGETAERRSEREKLYDLAALGARFFQQSLTRSPDVRAYLRSRGLSAEIIAEFGLGYAPGGYDALLRWLRSERIANEEAEKADLVLRGEMGWRDRFVSRVIFPIFDVEGRPVAFGGRTLLPDGIPKYLNSRETPIFSKGRTLYGLHRAKQAIPAAGFAVAVEGYMDLIALHQAGVDNSVATLGTALTENHVAILRRYATDLVMCYDGDGAGMRAAERNSAMFENAGCTVRVATLPAGEDPDTFIGTHGVEAFRSLLHRAPPLLEYQLEMLRTRYNLKDESARLPFVTEAARIISQSGSHLTRQEYAGKLSRILERLAEEWYPGDPHRAMQARSSLIQEVNRLLRLNRRDLAVRSAPRTPVGGGRWTPGPRREPGNTAFSPARPLASPSAKAERYVLRAALTEPRWAQWVAESTTREHFREGVHQLVVRSLLPETADMAPNEVEMPARVAQVLQNPASAEAVSALLVEETPLSDEGVGRCLMLLQREWKRGRLVQLQQELEAAPFPSDDPRRGELAELLGELGGRQYRED